MMDMKTLLFSLSISITNASTLRGPMYKTSKQLPLPDASCFRRSNTVDVCESEMSSDGINKCVWCQTKEDKGVCLSNDDAMKAIEIMEMPCPNYTSKLLTSQVAAPDFNCFRENAEATCKESTASDSSSCVWCSMAGGSGGVAGACLSNEEAIVANGQFGLTCPLEIYIEPTESKVRNGLPDVNCFKAAWVAENAEAACGESNDKDGNACVWCQTDGDVAGICLSKPQAGTANGQFGLVCPNNDDGDLDESLESF